jgi:hypothetical protein
MHQIICTIRSSHTVTTSSPSINNILPTCQSLQYSFSPHFLKYLPTSICQLSPPIFSTRPISYIFSPSLFFPLNPYFLPRLASICQQAFASYLPTIFSLSTRPISNIFSPSSLDLQTLPTLPTTDPCRYKKKLFELYLQSSFQHDPRNIVRASPCVHCLWRKLFG